ncbi:MAG TPA: VOC family protein [Pseudolabrys sp.]|nr:VOC family protein [Pseudolabrys sp.]
MAGAGLDHIVHAVRDLDAAAALYKRLGFQVGARNRHPSNWGTQNHIVQLPGTFIELLAVAETTGIAPQESRRFSFGAFNRDFLMRGEGLSMLVLEGHVEDAERFAAGGIGDFEPYYFEREGKRPDGTRVKVAFTLAFARDNKAPDIGFFTCRQHYPDNFWNPAFQSHANGAVAVAAVVLVANDLAQHRKFLTVFTGSDEWEEKGSGLVLTTPRGAIELVTPGEYSRRCDVTPPDITTSSRLAAIRFRVEDLTTIRAIFATSKIAHQSLGDRIVIDAETALGAALVFESINPSDR